MSDAASGVERSPFTHPLVLLTELQSTPVQRDLARSFLARKGHTDLSEALGRAVMDDEKFDEVYDELARAWERDCELAGFSVPYPPRAGGRTDRLITLATERILRAYAL